MDNDELKSKVREELLLLGLEDEIPVPEAMVFEEEISAAGFEPWKFVFGDPSRTLRQTNVAFLEGRLVGEQP